MSPFLVPLRRLCLSITVLSLTSNRPNEVYHLSSWRSLTSNILCPISAPLPGRSYRSGLGHATSLSWSTTLQFQAACPWVFELNILTELLVSLLALDFLLVLSNVQTVLDFRRQMFFFCSLFSLPWHFCRLLILAALCASCWARCN